MECAADSKNRFKAGFCIRRKCPIKALATETCFFSKLCHAASFCNFGQSSPYQRTITGIFSNTGCKESFLIGFLVQKVFLNIKRLTESCCHDSFLSGQKVFRKISSTITTYQVFSSLFSGVNDR